MASSLRRVRARSRNSAIGSALEFHGSAERSLGMELEFQIIDHVTGDLVPLGPRVIQAAAEVPYLNGRVHPELMENTVELVTALTEDGRLPVRVSQLRRDMARSIDAVREIAGRLRASIVLAGSHPFADPGQQSYTKIDRITEMLEIIGKPVRDLQTYGLHVHVGVPDGDAAIRAMNHLNRYLPHFLALSGSSPYWNGEDTRMASYRSPAFEALPLTGPPPTMNTWADYQAHVRQLMVHNRIEDGGRDDPWKGNKDIHWDVRPSPKFGTIELRICDATPTLREATALAALTQCLVDEAVKQRTTPQRLSDFWIRDNKDRAARLGLEMEVTVPGRARAVPLRDDIRTTVKRLQPIARRLGCTDELNDVLRILEHGPSAERQRATYQDEAGKSQMHLPGIPAPRPVTLDRSAARAVVAALDQELRTDTIAPQHFARRGRGVA